MSIDIILALLNNQSKILSAPPNDIAEISVKEEDLKLIPVMHAIINDQIKAQFETLEKDLRS